MGAQNAERPEQERRCSHRGPECVDKEGGKRAVASLSVSGAQASKPKKEQQKKRKGRRDKQSPKKMQLDLFSHKKAQERTSTKNQKKSLTARKVEDGVVLLLLHSAVSGGNTGLASVWHRGGGKDLCPVHSPAWSVSVNRDAHETHSVFFLLQVIARTFFLQKKKKGKGTTRAPHSTRD